MFVTHKRIAFTLYSLLSTVILILFSGNYKYSAVNIISFDISLICHYHTRLVLADAQCKQREFEEASHQLAIDEFLWKREKDAKASKRHQKETKLLLNSKRLRKAQEKYETI